MIKSVSLFLSISVSPSVCLSGILEFCDSHCLYVCLSVSVSVCLFCLLMSVSVLIIAVKKERRLKVKIKPSKAAAVTLVTRKRHVLVVNIRN
jgi:hypothetical protein